MALDHSKPSIYPTLRYQDAPGAISFLTKAFGFGEESLMAGDDGTVAHAELSWGNGVVMVATANGGPFDSGTAVLYLVTDDPDGHHDRAVAAGAEIVMELTDQDYGSREYAARDPEGNVWCFGTYQPTPRG